MSEESRPPISISERTKVRLPLAILISLLAVVATAAVVWSGDHNAVADHTEQLKSQAVRISELEEGQKDIAVIKNDVQWIRRALDRTAAVE